MLEDFLGGWAFLQDKGNYHYLLPITPNIPNWHLDDCFFFNDSIVSLTEYHWFVFLVLFDAFIKSKVSLKQGVSEKLI